MYILTGKGDWEDERELNPYSSAPNGGIGACGAALPGKQGDRKQGRGEDQSWKSVKNPAELAKNVRILPSSGTRNEKAGREPFTRPIPRKTYYVKREKVKEKPYTTATGNPY